MTGDRGQTAEDRRQMSEGRGQTAKEPAFGSRRKKEDEKVRRWEFGSRKLECGSGKRLKSEGGMRKWEKKLRKVGIKSESQNVEEKTLIRTE